MYVCESDIGEGSVTRLICYTAYIPSPSPPPCTQHTYLSNVDESLKWQANAEKAVVIKWYP